MRNAPYTKRLAVAAGNFCDSHGNYEHSCDTLDDDIEIDPDIVGDFYDPSPGSEFANKYDYVLLEFLPAPLGARLDTEAIPLGRTMKNTLEAFERCSSSKATLIVNNVQRNGYSLGAIYHPSLSEVVVRAASYGYFCKEIKSFDPIFRDFYVPSATLKISSDVVIVSISK